MNEKRLEIVIEDDFGSVQTRIRTYLSAPKLMDKIVKLFDNEFEKPCEKKFLLNTMTQPWKICCKDKAMPLIDVVILLNVLAEENEKLTKENDKLKETYNRLEEAIEKRGYEDIDEFW